jgi:psp operon transcriptional activator
MKQRSSERAHTVRMNLLPSGGEALGQSEAFLAFQERVSRVAPINRPVLVLGERGTGKELAASRLHYLSGRWQAPFVTLNCAALSPTLIEAELFGYEKGAFTGAEQRRIGRFEAAHQGTLFLDEIGNIPLVVQEKILRTVEYGTFERVGSSEPVEVDVRIIAATNADLYRLVHERRFKQDLLDRLSFEVLRVPPLRERKGDILLLAHHFAARMGTELGLAESPHFTEDAARALEAHPWPGNVRELKNTVERSVYRSGSVRIREVVFDPLGQIDEERATAQVATARKSDMESSIRMFMVRPLPQALQELEITMVKRALNQARYNQRRASEILGITYHQFRGLYRKHEKTLRDEREPATPQPLYETSRLENL